MRTITELSKLNGKVYAYLRNETIAKKFLIDADAEDFTFGDGVKPTERDISDLAANVCDYTPVSLGKLIKSGILSDITSIHRMTIDQATEKKEKWR